MPVATLCPCSKAISEYGAHNQRGLVSVRLLYKEFFWIEDVISMIEKCASTPLYTLLKRKDEKFVTENITRDITRLVRTPSGKIAAGPSLKKKLLQ